MRPRHLEVDGFTVFSDGEELNFGDLDLFALTGPTGAGKSSVVDAIGFALYGQVARLGANAVEPVISLSCNQASVVFTFAAHGATYTASRQVRRTSGGGATTKEARLERDGEVLAGTAKEVTEVVGEVLGLDFEQFTTCVVLPQGEFARLLQATPGNRNDLLVQLLGLGLYRQIARAARTRADEAAAQIRQADALLDQLAGATPETRGQLNDRIHTLADLRRRVAEATELAEADRDLENTAGERAATAEAAAKQLGEVTVPEGVADLSGEAAEATRLASEATEAAEAAEAALEPAETHRNELGDPAPLRSAREAHARRDEVAERRRQEVAKRDEAATATETARTELADAEATATRADEELGAARERNRVADLTASLVVGDPCPVCGQEVGEVPHVAGDGTVQEAERAKAHADTALAGARRRLEQANATGSGHRATVEATDQELARLDTTLEAWPDPAVVEDRLAAIEAADAALEDTRRMAREARTAANEAARRAERTDRALDEHRRAFETARDRVAGLEPPPAARRDLAADWDALASWAVGARPAQVEAAEKARDEVAAARDRRRQRLGGLVAEAAGLEVVARDDGADLLAAVAGAEAQATERRNEVARQLADAERHRSTREAAARANARADHIAKLLSARNFERWILDEALDALVAGATDLLDDLSEGAYGLTVDQKHQFCVIDHRNAGQRRAASTLSGGETFLASLALALALADQVASLAAEDTARLETLFLDEGFGSLDPDTLDVVTSAIEELGSQGRMVGLISHLAELAERVPVRFEVTRTPTGSVIERVEP